MIEVLANLAEIAAAVAFMVLLSVMLTNKKNTDDHTMGLVRIPVKSNRQNRK